MKTRYLSHSLSRVIAGILLLGGGWHAPANPTGMTVQSGSASSSTSGSTLTVTTSQNAYLNWQSFNIAAGETTIFNQPSALSLVINNIHDANASQIYGSLQANGFVVLMNSAGFYFGPNSFVKTGGLILSTANCIPPQNSGGSWVFNGPPPLASIINYGQIQVGNGGSAFLIANNVENHGDIEAPGGTVGLASGQTVLLSERPDGRGMSMQVTLPQGSVNNYGTIVADGGTIAMNAKVVNQNGLIQANSVRDQNGVIELVASDQLNLGANSQILARGDGSAGGSSGGSVTLQSGNNFSDDVGSRIDVTGGAQGGNGGNVEISAPNILSLNSAIDARAQLGWTAGKLLLDPDYIILDSSGPGSAGGGTVLAGSNPGSTLDLNVNSAFANFAVSQILLQAKYDITLAGGTSWNLSQTIGANLGGMTSGQLTLQAGRNIVLQDSSLISDANNWSVTLDAGCNFVNNTINYGQGSILLNGGSGSILTASGDINLMAGQDILVGSGYVVTTGGGSITAHALAGNIDTGSDGQGYHFVNNANSLSTAYNLSGGLGGISTAGGGDVTLIAGGNVTSVLPGNGAYYYDGNQITPDNGNDYLTAGSGAYGSQSGNVTIVAGGNVTGHYLVANGTGKIFAGVQMDANGNPVTDLSGNYVMGASGNAGADLSFGGLALSLIRGGWNVTAAQNILLQEVRNPNGDFNGSVGALGHYFNYAPGDYVDLTAGNLVELGASVSLPRLSFTSNPNNNVPVIYPSILNITAGDGGVLLGAPGSSTSLILFPSPQGSLTINTAGSLVGNLNTVRGAPQPFTLIVSDAGHNQYTSTLNFGASDHAATPVHLNHSTPIVLNVAGDMDLINLVVPEAAQINVGGNMNNCAFQGMNLSANDVTSINVAGDIYNRSTFTSIDLNQIPGVEVPDLSVLAQAFGNSLSSATLATSFYYNPATGTLTYQNISGVPLLTVLQVLNNLTVQEYINGVPQWQNPPTPGGSPPFDTIPVTHNVSVLGDPSMPGTLASELLAQYNALGALPASANGYTIGGGGQFDITARTIDLGTSAGIQSKGVALYTVHGSYPLAGLFGNGGVLDRGSDINITTTGNHSDGTTASGELVGDLDMYASSIASLDGGNISIHAGGDVNAGSSVFTVNAVTVNGIFSTSQGDVSVIANGNINVNGSRIATYDGGNITVESLNGNINAGKGASTPVSVTGYYENPITHVVYSYTPQLPFSGIVALTFPDRNPKTAPNAYAAYPAPTATLGNILVESPNGDINANAAGILQIALNGLDYPNAVTTVLAGYELRDSSGNAVLAANSQKAVAEPLPVSTADSSDPARTVIVDGTKYHVSATVWAQLLAVLDSPADSQVLNLHIIGDGTAFVAALQGDGTGLANSINYFSPVSSGRNINVNGSGIIASNVRLDASGNINGLIFSANNIDIIAQQTVDVTALGIGKVTAFSSGGPILGRLTGLQGVDAIGPEVIADLVSANVNGTTSGQTGLGQGTAANATSQAASSSDASQAVVSSDKSDDDSKKKKEVALAQKIGRVTVILPGKSPSNTSSQKQTATQPL